MAGSLGKEGLLAKWFRSGGVGRALTTRMVSLHFETHTALFGTNQFKWKIPTPPEKIRTQKFGLVLFFLPDFLKIKSRVEMVIGLLWGFCQTSCKKVSSAHPSQDTRTRVGCLTPPRLSIRNTGRERTKMTLSSNLYFRGWFSKRVVLADVPPERKPERGYIRPFLSQ